MTKITVAPQNQPLYDRIERLENNLEVTMKALSLDIALAEIAMAPGIAPSVTEAMKTLRRAMKDDGMANGWHANIAVLLTDEGVPYDRAQERAAGFMKMVFDRDTLNLPR